MTKSSNPAAGWIKWKRYVHTQRVVYRQLDKTRGRCTRYGSPCHQNELLSDIGNMYWRICGNLLLRGDWCSSGIPEERVCSLGIPAAPWGENYPKLPYDYFLVWFYNAISLSPNGVFVGLGVATVSTGLIAYLPKRKLFLPGFVDHGVLENTVFDEDNAWRPQKQNQLYIKTCNSCTQQIYSQSKTGPTWVKCDKN